MNDDLKKAKALQKEYLKARAAKETTDDLLTWLLKRKAALKGFGMARRRSRRAKRYSGFGGVFGEVFSEGFGALPLLLGIPLVKVALIGGAGYYLLKKKQGTPTAASPGVGASSSAATAPSTAATAGMGWVNSMGFHDEGGY